ncbi:MAG: hypothetical protein QM533_07180 [Cytophagales bacterium]|nr:hypothetical protein [Cytophagales bacterium]
MSNKGKRITKPVVYKQAQFHTKPTGTLKQLLSKAIKQLNQVQHRKKLVSADPNAPSFHLIGHTKDELNEFLFGALLAYSPGVAPLFLVDDGAAADVTLEKIKVANTTAGMRRELLNSILYFGVFDNHLVLMQSQSLKSLQAEMYFQWFLHQSGTLAKTNTVTLLDTPSAAVREKIESSKGIRGIKLGGGQLLPRSAMPKTEKLVQEKEVEKVSFSPIQSTSSKGVIGVLKSLLSPVELANIDLDTIAESNIELTLLLRYKTKTTIEGHKLMDSLGAALRHSEDFETELELEGGGTLKGSELKLTGDVKVTAYDGHISETEVYEAMRTWLLQKIDSQDVKT